MGQLENVGMDIQSKTEKLSNVLSTTKTAQVLEQGGKSLKSRLENLVNSSSSEITQVQDFKGKLISTLTSSEIQSKGTALLESAKNRIVKKLNEVEIYIYIMCCVYIDSINVILLCRSMASLL
jgi:hypothetical protein